MAEKAVVIIPTYDEASNILALLPRVLEQGENIDILVVDDNSPDGTGILVDDIARSNSRVHVIHRPDKEGLGSAYLTGFKWALEHDYQFVFEMDADLSHDPKHLPEFLEAAKNADLVLGSRYLNGRVTVVNWPMPRLMLSYAANIYARLVTGHRLYDATGGYKCFRRGVLESIDLGAVRSNGYSFQIEVTFRAWRRKFRIKEIPIVFVDRTEGHSKMSRGIIWEAIWMVWRLRLKALFRRL